MGDITILIVLMVISIIAFTLLVRKLHRMKRQWWQGTLDEESEAE